KAVTQQWGMGGDKSRALNAVTTAITGALGGQTDLQVAANTLAPYAANVIGEKFGHGEDKNKAAQLASHAILGATLAYLNGGNPAAGGSAAVASEAAADYFANQYNDGKTAINPETGEFDANLLPENVKSGIRDLTAAIGAVVGGTVGDSASNAQLAGVIGQNAVENNEFSIITKGVEKKLAENKKEKEAQAHLICPKGQSCIIPIPEKSLGDKALNVINNMTLRQLAAVAGAKYDPLTGEEITPNERQIAKASMLGLGLTRTVSGVTRLTDDALIVIEKKIAESLWGTWNQYPKVLISTPNGQQEFANIGGRLYSQHAVARMQPSYQRYSSGVAEGTLYNTTGKPIPGITSYDGREMIRGRSISPNYVEDIIKNASPIKQQNGNWSYKSGDLNVILSPDRKRVITIVTEKE
ncbi:VENN motif pre-toxin domain-containing protein, partial [Acinetobacter baumannii]|nr:VENN motif pre-toxin domain-containing protein [Acinetobacter baumannii]